MMLVEEFEFGLARVRRFKSLPSTNKYLINFAFEDKANIELVMADTQSNGAGRHERRWFDNGDAALFSIGLYLPASKLQALSLVVGIAVARYVEKLGVMPQLKWPNDVYVAGKKLCGILIELKPDVEGLVKVIIGIGVNVASAPNVDQLTTCLQAEAKQILSAQDVVLGIYQGFEAMLPGIRQQDCYFTTLQVEYNALDYLHQQCVKVVQSNQIAIGFGVNKAGEYQLQTDQGLLLHSSGELSLRRCDDIG